MRTVGEILKKARLEKKLTFEEVEKNLRIRKKFLIALEENDWSKLPSLPYIKGFLRNYSSFLGLKPDEMIAFFRRQFATHEKGSLLPEGVINPLDKPLFHLTPHFIAIATTIIFIIFFFGYLFLQYKTFISSPNLTLIKPAEGEIIASETVQVLGKTDPDAVVSINNQKIALLENGEFSTQLTLTPGVHTITVESTSKYGKKRILTRTIKFQENQ